MKRKRENSIMISFRVPESAYEPYKDLVKKSGGNRSKYFRALLLENDFKKDVVLGAMSVSADHNKYLHLVNKVSNNLNQLARLLNGAEKSGKITAAQYLSGLNNLNTMRVLLNSKLGSGD